MNRVNICSNSRICSNSIKFYIILITTIILLLFLDKGNSPPLHNGRCNSNNNSNNNNSSSPKFIQVLKVHLSIPDSDTLQSYRFQNVQTLKTASIDMSFHLTNRNGQLEKGYLSITLLYQTYIMIIFCCLFFTVTIFGIVHKSSLNILHILYIVLVLKLILIIVQYSFWTD
ncbi:hypothetical protein ACTFIW_006089, partial [Dictyostelium discoideum]